MKLYMNGKHVLQSPAPQFFTVSMEDCYQQDATYHEWVKQLVSWSFSTTTNLRGAKFFLGSSRSKRVAVNKPLSTSVTNVMYW